MMRLGSACCARLYHVRLTSVTSWPFTEGVMVGTVSLPCSHARHIYRVRTVSVPNKTRTLKKGAGNGPPGSISPNA